ncbi:MAG: hypothetical protein LAQ30_11950 [Acidobacteriia bacterium]|nr:hypothetical protein [Terriglobia bacterium]
MHQFVPGDPKRPTQLPTHERTFGWSEERAQGAETLLVRFARFVPPSQTLNVIKEDEPDNRILECAAEAGSEYIVSGDKDLHRLGQYGNAQVIKVADMLDIIQGKGWRSPGR